MHLYTSCVIIREYLYHEPDCYFTAVVFFRVNRTGNRNDDVIPQISMLEGVINERIKTSGKDEASEPLQHRCKRSDGNVLKTIGHLLGLARELFPGQRESRLRRFRIIIMCDEGIHNRHHEQREQGTDTQTDGDHQADVVA